MFKQCPINLLHAKYKNKLTHLLLLTQIMSRKKWKIASNFESVYCSAICIRKCGTKKNDIPLSSMSHSLNYLLSLTLRTYRNWSPFSPFAGTAEGSTINNVQEDGELHNITVQEQEEINFQTFCSPQVAEAQAGLHHNMSVIIWCQRPYHQVQPT